MSRASRLRLWAMRGAGEAWRGPVLAVLSGRPWTAILSCLAAVLCTLPATVHTPTWIMLLESYGVAALALALARGIVAGDRTSARWPMLFQRPVTPRAHYARVALASYAALVALVVLVWGAHAWLARHEWSARALASLLTASSLWGTVLFVGALCASTLLRRGDAECTILWAFLPLAATLLVDALGGGAAIKAALEWCCPPVNAIFGLQRRIADPAAPWFHRWTAQLVVFPALCGATAWWRLGVLANEGPAGDET